jgi:transcriptional regulator with XRE-family HTH domain
MTDNSYINWASMTDKALEEQIGAYIKHHRLRQNKTQEDLSKAAGISRSTLSLLERGESILLPGLIRVLRALDLLSIMDAFKINTSLSPIALARMEREKRQRAGSKKENNINESEW